MPGDALLFVADGSGLLARPVSEVITDHCKDGEDQWKGKVAAVVLLLAVGLGTVGYVLFAPGGNAQAQSQFLTAAVSLGNVTQQVVATGSVRSATTYSLAFGSDPVLSTSTASTSSASSASTSNAGSSSGTWLVKDVAVAVGDRVAKGDVLASADPANAMAALDLAKANLAVAKARLAVDKAGLTEPRHCRLQLKSRQARRRAPGGGQESGPGAVGQRSFDLKLSQAKAALAKTRQQLVDDQAAGPASATINADQAAINQAQQQLDTLNLQITGAVPGRGRCGTSRSARSWPAAQTRSDANQAWRPTLPASPQVPAAISTDQAAVRPTQRNRSTHARPPGQAAAPNNGSRPTSRSS